MPMYIQYQPDVTITTKVLRVIGRERRKTVKSKN